MSAREDEFLQSLRVTSKVEAEEHLQVIASSLLDLEKTSTPDEQRTINQKTLRAAHRLKGAAHAVNFTDIESIYQSAKDAFVPWKREGSDPSPQALETVHRGPDAVARIVAGSEAQQPRGEAIPRNERRSTSILLRSGHFRKTCHGRGRSHRGREARCTLAGSPLSCAP